MSEKRARQQRRRRENLKRAGTAWTMRDKAGWWLAFNGKCAYCVEEEMVGYDHVIPVSEGGETAPYNMLPCCVACNSSKGDEEVVSWLCWKGWDGRWPAIEAFLKTAAASFSKEARHLDYGDQ